MRGAAGWVAIAVAALGLAACGGGQEPISKDEYLKRAQQVCTEGTNELEKVTSTAFSDLKPGEKPTEEQIASFVRKSVVPEIRKQVRELRDLPPPEGGEKQVNDIYDALDQGLDQLDKDPKLLFSGANPFAKADELGKKYGLSVCAATS
jgi:hypothetical protein